MSGAQVVHAIDGRLRVRVPTIKNDPARAAAVCAPIRSIRGVQRVVANPVTGSITVVYDSARLTGETVSKNVAQIVGCSLLWVPTRSTEGTPRLLSDAGHHFAQALVKTAMEAALQRALLALI